MFACFNGYGGNVRNKTHWWYLFEFLYTSKIVLFTRKLQIWITLGLYVVGGFGNPEIVVLESCRLGFDVKEGTSSFSHYGL